jgi:hypothetical protein
MMEDAILAIDVCVLCSGIPGGVLVFLLQRPSGHTAVIPWMT